MTFNSYLFLIFFPVVVCVYFLIPHKLRWIWLLLCSCFFYAAFIPAYLFVLFILILIDFFAAIFIEKSSGKRRKLFLWISIVSTCFVLFIFKYFDFFNSSAAFLAQQLGLNYPVKILSLILPLGLSFHTFQSLGYVIDVYHKKVKAERNLGIYALYVMFFPQLVAGPIERASHLLPQLRQKHDPDPVRMSDGLKLMMWGMFKKIVIADRLAVIVNEVYANPQNFQGPELLIATVFFAFQIYCDFSGYSDIAIGSAKVMGFDLMKNFNLPYLAGSIGEFWQRWHISLSTWFRDYVYIPLGGNRCGVLRWRLNILLTFLLSGLWHGANWTFVVWGLLHASYYLLFKNRIGAFATFVLVTFAWIVFRANNIGDAWFVFTHLFDGWGSAISFSLEQIFVAVSLIIFLIWAEKQSMDLIVSRLPSQLRFALYVVGALVLMNFGVAVAIPFIYFQF